MLEAGLVTEVQNLLQAGIPADARPLQAIGYKEELRRCFAEHLCKPHGVFPVECRIQFVYYIGV